MESELEELAWLGDWVWLTVSVPIHPKDVDVWFRSTPDLVNHFLMNLAL